MTAIVPPSAFIPHRAVMRVVSIVVSVKRRESRTAMIFQRISYKFRQSDPHVAEAEVRFITSAVA